MLSLAWALEIKVVAEGIETSEQWSRLQELGCLYGQGHYFSPPLPVEEASRNMARLEKDSGA
jgi:EAL domain-containing protein (putative c-di-GMP-specific phosphodiesterase class I)